jgi:sugar phosphate isomerase/epimerase
MLRFFLAMFALTLASAVAMKAGAAEKWDVACRDGGYLQGMGLSDVWSAMEAIGISRVEVRVSEDLSCPGLFENGSAPYRIDTPPARGSLRQKLAEKKKSIAAFCAVVRLEKDKSDDAAVEWIEKIARAAIDLERPVIVVPIVGGGFSDEEFVERATGFVRRLVPVAERYEVQITLENLGHYWNRREILEPVLKAVPSDRVGLALDITNMYWFGHPLSKLYELAATFSPYVRYVHVKNVNYPEERREVQRPEGWQYGKYAAPVKEGDIDFRKIIALLSKAGYRGDLTLEDDSLGKYDAAGQRKVLREDVQLLREIISELRTGGRDMGTGHSPLKEVDGWVRSPRPRKVNRDNIFDYMDGAGELYLAYAFVGLEVWKYEKPDEPEILLEVYEMEEPPEAFGVLSFELSGEEVGIGQKSLYAAGLLRFWKGKHFVRILAEAETPAARKAVLKIGKDLAAVLPGKGSLPALVGRLPEKGLVPESIHFFHKKICLDYFYYLADDNILNLGENTDAVIADYGTPSGPAKLLAVEYDSESSSEKAWASFHSAYLNQPPPESGVIDSKKIEGGQWVCARREGRLSLIAFEGKSRKDCERLLREATASLSQGG